MRCTVRVLPQERLLQVRRGENLLQALREAGLAPPAPCGGEGRCGKCRVTIGGEERLACRVAVEADLIVTLPQDRLQVLTGPVGEPTAGPQTALAFDIGTTTVAGWLMAGGRVAAAEGAPNPQRSFGADVVSRIRAALQGQQEAMTRLIRQLLEELSGKLCAAGGISPEQVERVCIVGNPTMQQLFLGISPENLASPPFSPVLKRLHWSAAAEYLPSLKNAQLLTVPDPAGYVGADTVAAILATGLDRGQGLRLLVDIGTNGEIALGNCSRMAVCATAAGPALEGAGISCGMSARSGAIDRVEIRDGSLCCLVIGGEKARGICGSGLVSAVAAALELGLLNERGRILREDRLIPLADGLALTQEDIRAFQSAKGAIAAGIRMLLRRLDAKPEDVERVYLAGAFGSAVAVSDALRTGLLPAELAGKCIAAGNAAGAGARLLALDGEALRRCEELMARIDAPQLGAMPGFAGEFARNMRFTK